MYEGMGSKEMPAKEGGHRAQVTGEESPFHRSAVESAGEALNKVPDLVVSEGHRKKAKRHQCAPQRLAAATGGYKCRDGEPLRRQQCHQQKDALEESTCRTVL
jgi:hypothetical protein